MRVPNHSLSASLRTYVCNRGCLNPTSAAIWMPELAPHVHTEPSLLAYRHLVIPILTVITVKAFSFSIRDNPAPALVAYDLFGRPQSSPSRLHSVLPLLEQPSNPARNSKTPPKDCRASCRVASTADVARYT